MKENEFCLSERASRNSTRSIDNGSFLDEAVEAGGRKCAIKSTASFSEDDEVALENAMVARSVQRCIAIPELYR